MATASAVGNPKAVAATARVGGATSGAGLLRMASSTPKRGTVMVAAAMQPAKAVAAEASPLAAAENDVAAAARLARPDAFGRFGKFGGKYARETLMHALTELEAAFHALAGDDQF
ncbi:hypothetical protein GUJ93_ZPchr0009g1591 [Zizania palustris]|uniref:Uncharacterized protein n=1 Tax=Zizania palustris TaxID=103762 RepID=A0A8J5RKV4_ZIZPA|nr:hypothetical protein GUJ93_ZPchr0009g1591 [Zizania palustris]